jgi:hypothetical protein
MMAITCVQTVVGGNLKFDVWFVEEYKAGGFYFRYSNKWRRRL